MLPGCVTRSKRPWRTRLDFHNVIVQRLVAHIAHQARLDTPDKTGAIPRKHYLQRLNHAFDTYGEHSKRYAEVLKDYDGPECPEEGQYLLDWHWELYAKSGVSDMGQVKPLEYATIEYWTRTKHQHPKPHEIDALFILDSIRRSPPPEEEPIAYDG